MNESATRARPPIFTLPGAGFGFVVISAGLLIFAWMFANVQSEGFLWTLDQRLAAQFAAAEAGLSAEQEAIVQVVGKLGSNGTAMLAILLAFFWIFRRAWRKLVLILFAMAGAELLWLLMIFTIKRPRPQTVVSAVGIELPSFPSGHALIVVVLYGLLLYMYWPSLSAAGRVIAPLLAAVWILATGFVRLLVGAHYLTDVIAGYAFGAAWLVFAVLVVERFFPRPQPFDPRPEV